MRIRLWVDSKCKEVGLIIKDFMWKVLLDGFIQGFSLKDSPVNISPPIILQLAF